MSLRKKRWRDLVHLVRRLELGLILVSFEGRRPSLEVVHEPGFFNRKRSINQGKKERTKLIDEAKNRRSNHNIGGSRSEEHTSELQSRGHLVCRLLLEKKKENRNNYDG